MFVQLSWTSLRTVTDPVTPRNESAAKLLFLPLLTFESLVSNGEVCLHTNLQQIWRRKVEEVRSDRAAGQSWHRVGLVLELAMWLLLLIPQNSRTALRSGSGIFFSRREEELAAAAFLSRPLMIFSALSWSRSSNPSKVSSFVCFYYSYGFVFFKAIRLPPHGVVAGGLGSRCSPQGGWHCRLDWGYKNSMRELSRHTIIHFLLPATSL